MNNRCFTVILDCLKEAEWELTLAESRIFIYLISNRFRVMTIKYGNEFYHFFAKTNILKNNPILVQNKERRKQIMNADSITASEAQIVYRAYKSLEKKGLIKHHCINGRDYITITKKGNSWGKEDGLVERFYQVIEEQNPKDWKEWMNCYFKFWKKQPNQGIREGVSYAETIQEEAPISYSETIQEDAPMSYLKTTQETDKIEEKNEPPMSYLKTTEEYISTISNISNNSNQYKEKEINTPQKIQNSKANSKQEEKEKMREGLLCFATQNKGLFYDDITYKYAIKTLENKEQLEFCFGVIQKWNETTGNRVKLTKTRLQAIKKITSTKIYLDDKSVLRYGLWAYKDVFEHKFEQWKDNEKMKQHIKIDTMLRYSNFTRYFEEAQASKNERMKKEYERQEQLRKAAEKWDALGAYQLR